ncbi:MAG TPA: hypothetical protein VLH61_07570 [Bacteroidales bacterium]|nr:hypothetical protein [Bacteroidales bacterium]
MVTTLRQIFLRLLIVLLFGALSACIGPGGENEPVRVNFDSRFDIRTQTPAYFSFSRAILSINSIRFQGIRQAGNDVAFSTRPDLPVGVYVFTPSDFLKPVTWFDIPEGVYNSMRWEIILNPLDDDFGNDDDDAFSFEGYGFIIEGHYTRIDGTRVLMIFALEEDELLRLQTVDLQGQTTITLIVDRQYSIELLINPFNIMGGIPRSMLEQAELDVENGYSYLLISPHNNEELYNLMILRLAMELRAVIK